MSILPNKKPSSEPKLKDPYTTEQVVTSLNNAVVACCAWDALDRSHSRLLKMRNVVEALMSIMRETQAKEEMEASDLPPLFSDPEIVMCLQAAALFFLVGHLDPADPLRRRAALGLVALPKAEELP